MLPCDHWKNHEKRCSALQSQIALTAGLWTGLKGQRFFRRSSDIKQTQPINDTKITFSSHRQFGGIGNDLSSIYLFIFSLTRQVNEAARK